nr:hypothetical protein [Tanacetum cinerariifolium]
MKILIMVEMSKWRIKVQYMERLKERPKLKTQMRAARSACYFEMSSYEAASVLYMLFKTANALRIYVKQIPGLNGDEDGDVKQFSDGMGTWMEMESAKRE